MQKCESLPEIESPSLITREEKPEMRIDTKALAEKIQEEIYESPSWVVRQENADVAPFVKEEEQPEPTKKKKQGKHMHLTAEKNN